MQYKSVFTVVFDAPNDRVAQSIAEQHYEQLLDALRVEGADHPYEFALDRLTAENDGSGRDVITCEKQAI